MSSASRVVLGVGEEYDGILKVVEDQKKKGRIARKEVRERRSVERGG